MISEQEANALAKAALQSWDPHIQATDVHLRRLTHGWRCEMVRTGSDTLGSSHPGVTTLGRVVRIPDGIPDEVADEILSAAID